MKMREDYKIYKLLEVIEMPTGTDLHMINGDDYKINKNGELVSKDGESLPISKRNIDNCEFTIIEDPKNYNFRIYKDNKLISSFNKIIEESNARMLAKDLYDKYQDINEEKNIREIYFLANETYLYAPRHAVEVKVEEIVGSY
jgi:predicted nucleotidyltransferase component of viral defense system